MYFVSSNAHSIINLVTGFALTKEKELLAFLQDSDDAALKEEWEKIQAEVVRAPRENFLYYLLKKSSGSPLGEQLDSKHGRMWRQTVT